MEELLLPEEERNRLRDELQRKEQQLARESRKRLSPGDFEPLVLIGNGAFGEVRLVRKRDSKQIFAMKTMLKQAMVMKNQVAHVRAERDLLAAADNPWVVKLHYSFQDANTLYMAMEYCPGGDLMGLLMKEDTFTCVSLNPAPAARPRPHRAPAQRGSDPLLCRRGHPRHPERARPRLHSSVRSCPSPHLPRCCTPAHGTARQGSEARQPPHRPQRPPQADRPGPVQEDG